MDADLSTKIFLQVLMKGIPHQQIFDEHPAILFILAEVMKKEPKKDDYI